MANSKSEHNRKLRVASANRRIQRIRDEGGKLMTILLHAPAYAALTRERARRGGISEGACIEKILLELEEKS